MELEWNPQTLQFLSESFVGTLSPQPEPRRRAEKNLSDAADAPNYGPVVLRLVAETSVEEHIRQCAAINLKNHLKTRWATSSATRVPDGEKEQIKTLIAPLMLSAAPRIQSQLIEALAGIGNHDFPKLWLDLLPECKSSLETAIGANDFASVNGILATVDSLFKKFRYELKSDPVLLDLKYCVDNFAAPLLSTVESISGKINDAAGSVATLVQLIEAQRLCCMISYSLNSLAFFEDNADKWMNEFKNYLTMRWRDGLSAVDELQVAVCEIISHYMEKEEELFQKYLQQFAEAVCSLLVVASASPSRERLTMAAIKFLTMVSTSVHHGFFSGDETLQQITHNIIAPNVMLRDEDEEIFEMNYVEFIRRDMEGSDLDTRRRIACDLLKGIAGNYKQKITQSVSTLIHSCLALFAEDPAGNWKYKDCAIYLVVSLATRKAGGASISTDLVDVESFFKSVVVPELQQGQEANASPMLKASALKFFTVFHVLIPKPIAMALLGDVVRLSGSVSNVVHSYAASCIEKLLLVKDYDGVQLQARFTSMDIAPILLVLMTNLFGALEKPESGENPYIMRCIMRVLQVADISPEVASPSITRLTAVLNRVCENPKNPVFNHYLFEAVATLARRNPSLVPAFDTCFLPSLQMILAKQVTELVPYAFQLLAQLVDLNRPSIPPYYVQIVDILLTPSLWKKPANVPALVRLLQSVLQLAPNELLNREGGLRHVLGNFNKLVSSFTTEEEGFRIINGLIENLGHEVMAGYMNQIWVSLFTRLQNSKTPTLVRRLIVFMSLFLVKHGIQALVDSINSVQANLFQVILGQFWIPNLKTITTEVKLIAVASAKLLCGSPSLLDPAAEELLGKLLDGIVTLLSLPEPEEERVEDEPDFGEATGYQATILRLHNVAKKEEDPLKEIKDPKHFSVDLLVTLSSRFHGRFPLLITRYLSPANQAALLQLCDCYNLSVV